MSIKIVSERTKAEKEWEKRKIEIEEMLENAIIEICYFFEGTGTNVGERLIELVHYCAQKLMQKDIKDEEKANFEKYLKEPIEEGLKYMICEYCNDDRANLKKNNKKYIEYFLGMSMILNETMEINIKAPKLLPYYRNLERQYKQAKLQMKPNHQKNIEQMERALGLIEPSNDERTEGKVIEIKRNDREK